MGWTYHTSVRPRRRRTDGDAGNLEYKQEYENSFNKLFDFCISDNDIADIKKLLDDKSKTHRFEIKTMGDNDEIDPDSDYHVKFTKSRFLGTPRFKKALIDYYNPSGIYVKGPYEVKKQETQNNVVITKEWIIDFSLR